MLITVTVRYFLRALVNYLDFLLLSFLLVNLYLRCGCSFRYINLSLSISFLTSCFGSWNCLDISSTLALVIVVGQEDREIIPESFCLLSCFHDLLDIKEQMISQCPYAY